MVLTSIWAFRELVGGSAADGQILLPPETFFTAQAGLGPDFGLLERQFSGLLCIYGALWLSFGSGATGLPHSRLRIHLTQSTGRLVRGVGRFLAGLT
jgi:hypothetical protein